MDEMMSTVGSSARDVPWTTDDVRKSSHHWTLAGDAALLNKLQDIAQNLVSMTHKVQQEVDTLVQDSSASHSKLGNVINEFLMLSNTQFVENRVYDDEVTDATPSAKKRPSPDRTAEEQRTQIVTKVSEALRLGMSVIETAYEQLHVQSSDSEDESETDGRYTHEPILRPKDPYRGRPLPCVIGSSVFLEDDHVGLTAPVLSDEEHVEEDVKSVSSIEENIPKHNEVMPKDYSSEDENNVENGFSRSTERRDSEKSGDSDLFDPEKKNADICSERSSSSSRRESSDVLTVDRLPKTADFQKELASKLQPNMRRSDSTSDANVEGDGLAGRRSSKSSRNSARVEDGNQRISVQKKNVEANFHQEDSGDDDDSGLFAPKKGLFSVKERLFDDSVDEEDLFFEKQSSSGKKESSNRKTDSHNPSFEPTNGSLALPKTTDSLFDDDGVLDATPTKAPITTKEAKAIDSLFDEGNDDSIFEIDITAKNSKSSTPIKKVLPGAVSMFGSSVDPLAMRKPLKQTAKLENKVTHKKDTGVDNDDGIRVSSETSSRSSSSVSSTRDTKALGGPFGRVSPAPSITSRSSTALFAEEPEVDDLFSTAAVTKHKPIGGISLFDDDKEEDDDIFTQDVKLDASKKKRKNKVDVDPQLSESASSFFDDIFAQIVKPRESSRKLSAAALFDDDMPATPRKTVNTDSTMTSKMETVQEKSKAPRKVSLFDDDNDSDNDGAPIDDLFGISAKKSSTSTVKGSSEGRGQSLLFDDDESLLFGTAPSSSSLLFNNDNLEVDLFEQSSVMKEDVKPATETSASDNKKSAETTRTSPEKKTTPLKEKTPVVKASTSKTKEAVDDEEDDLFVKNNEKTDALRKSCEKSVEKSGSLSPKLSISSAKSDVKSSKDKRKEEPETSTVSNLEPTSDGNLALSPSRKKPPVGGVALFGGALTPVLKPKSSRDKSTVSPSDIEKSVSPKPERRSISPFGGSSSILPRVNVNTAKQAVDFDKPVEANPLHNANKDRIKIQVKRRPPTRRGRQEAIRRSAIDMVVDDGDDVDDSELEVSATVSAPTSPLTSDSEKIAEFTIKLPSKVGKADKSEAPLPSSDDRVKSPSPSTISKPVAAKDILPAVVEKCAKHDSSDSESDGLFVSDGKQGKKKVDSLVTSNSKSTLKKSVLSDLDSDSTVDDDLFSSKAKSAKAFSKSAHADDSSSLFGPSEPKDRTSKLGRGKSLFDDDDDDDDEDIFKAVSAKKSISSSSSKTSTRSSTKTNEKKEFEDPLMANRTD